MLIRVLEQNKQWILSFIATSTGTAITMLEQLDLIFRITAGASATILGIVSIVKILKEMKKQKQERKSE